MLTMRRSLIALVLAGLAGPLLLAGCSTSSAAQTVGPQEWVTEATQPGVTIIDVRTAEEYAAGHVEGAINIDVEAPTFDAEIAQLGTDGTYALYCRSGRRSAIAADAMDQAGFTDVINLQGGIADLQAAGAPIVAG